MRFDAKVKRFGTIKFSVSIWNLTCFSENPVPTYKLKIVTSPQAVIITSLSVSNSATEVKILMVIRKIEF